MPGEDSQPTAVFVKVTKRNVSANARFTVAENSREADAAGPPKGAEAAACGTGRRLPGTARGDVAAHGEG